MKFSHMAVIYGDEESEECAVLAEYGQQAREVLAAFDRLSGNPPPKCRDQGNRKGIMLWAGVLEMMGERGTWSQVELPTANHFALAAGRLAERQMSRSAMTTPRGTLAS